MIIMTNNDYNHYEIIQRKRHGGGAKLFRTLLMFLSVSSGIDRCYWPYGQMRLSTPLLGTTAGLIPAVQAHIRNFVVFRSDL